MSILPGFFEALSEKPPISDWINLLAALLFIALLVGAAEFIRNRSGWPGEFTRKLVHISIGLLIFFTPALFQTLLPLFALGLAATLFTGLTLKLGILPGINHRLGSYGLVYYCLSFVILLLLTWPNQLFIMIAAMLVLAIGDAAAAIVGQTLPTSHFYRLIDDDKTIEGSATMFLSSAAILFGLLLFYPFETNFNPFSAGRALEIALFGAAIATAAEALGFRGNDNLTIPASVGITLYTFLLTDLATIQLFSNAILLAGLLAILSFRLRLLSGSGSVMVFLLGAAVFGFGGLFWTIPMLTFFLLSSLLSKISKRVRPQFEKVFEKSSRRDHMQVLANGGIGGLLVIFYHFFGGEYFFWAYLASLAAATADTWATEIGTLAGQTPRKITDFSPVEPGTSGGITIAGSIGALVGAIVLTISALPFLESSDSGMSLLFGWVIFCGFLGNLVDSLAGATIQVQYRCPVCGKQTEKDRHCQDQPGQVTGGYPAVNNDIVNIIGITSAVICFSIGYYLFMN